MSSILNKIKKTYKEDLSNYKYIPPDDIPSIQEGSYICYIKPNLEKKHGYVISIRNKDNIDNIIIELKNNLRKEHWFIYTKDMYIFIKERKKDQFRDMLQEFIDNDFSNLTVVTQNNDYKNKK